MYSTLEKLRRHASGYLDIHDKENIKVLLSDTREYLNSFIIFDYLQAMYNKRKEQLKER